MTKFSFPPRCVPVRYAHLHSAWGEGKEHNDNNQKQSTKFISGLDPRGAKRSQEDPRGVARSCEELRPPSQ
jgi:hypothetical protein